MADINANRKEPQGFGQAEKNAVRDGSFNHIDTTGTCRGEQAACPQKSVKTVAIQRSLLGFPLGIAIGVVIAIGVSLAFADGRYHPVAPKLLDVIGSELGAVIVQTILNGVFGTMWAGSSVIFLIERWSLTRQTLTHFAIALPSSLAVALASAWISTDLAVSLIFSGIWVVIYALIWLSQTLYWRSQVKKLNSQL
jgi:hypothetical protein